MDPFVPEALDDEPRQLRNLAPGVVVPPAEAWWADRPAELGPRQPSGPMRGNPGPDIGYALSLVERRRDVFKLAPHEHFTDAAAVVSEVAMKRAAGFGRAPVLADLDLAIDLLGYREPPADGLAAWRRRATHEAAHLYPVRRAIVDRVPAEVLRLPNGEAAARVPEVRAALVAGAD